LATIFFSFPSPFPLFFPSSSKVVAAKGNIHTEGALKVATGNTTLAGTVKASGNLTIGDNLFRVVATNGNVQLYQPTIVASASGVATVMEQKCKIVAANGNIHSTPSFKCSLPMATLLFLGVCFQQAI
jgi:hypothetical protein